MTRQESSKMRWYDKEIWKTILKNDFKSCFGMFQGYILLFIILCLWLIPVAIPQNQRHSEYFYQKLTDDEVVRNLNLNHKHTSAWEQTVPNPINWAWCICIPWCCHAFTLASVGELPILEESLSFIHGGALSVSLNHFITDVIKKYAAYPRPYFYDKCDWSDENLKCMDQHGKDSALQSFPSGHASTASSAFSFTTFYLLGRCQFAVPRDPLKAFGNKYLYNLDDLKLILCIFPMFIAIFICSSRVVDNHHHPADVITGFIIGFLVSSLFYTRFYHSPFSEDKDTAGRTRLKGYSEGEVKNENTLKDSLMKENEVTPETSLLPDPVDMNYSI